MTKRKDVPHARNMVGWFDPPVLAQSAWLVAVSNVFGRHSDTRLIEALSGLPQTEFDYSHSDGEFWFDFVCDTGDGWDATYAIANTLAEPELEVTHTDGRRELTERGSVLIFGGDEVYPYPSQREYVSRTEAPYEAAFCGRENRPHIFAIPGNHDWYDSLIAFSRTFCRPDRGFAGCKTHQTRSYFALKLPGDWWFIGLDLQLGAEMDEPQTVYFKRVAEKMSPTARLILCVPEPRWILEQAYPRHESYSEDAATAFLEEKVFKRKVSVFVTGDLHFYKRHENAAGIQKITAGGGGAFLHPTHAPSTKTLYDGFVERAAFPSEATSRRLAWRNLLFPFLNPRYMILPAFVYSLSAWLASASLTEREVESLDSAVAAVIHAAVRDPLNGLWLINIIVAFVFFTDTHVRWWRIIGGVSHALSQLAAAFFVGWAAFLVTVPGMGLVFASTTQLALSGLLTFILGGLLGGLMMGIYLLVSVQVFGRHSNEAFSSLRIMDYKQWLRLRIDSSGALSIFCIGLERVPRRWQLERRKGYDTYAAADRNASRPQLVDFVKLP